jgi:predicted ATPase
VSGEVTLVGRDRELELMRDALQRAREGRVSVVSIAAISSS